MAGPHFSMRCAYRRLKVALLGMGFVYAVWFGAGWVLTGPPTAPDGRRLGAETPAGSRERGAPPLIRDRLHQDEQIHRIYLCTTHSRVDLDADLLEHSWACVATSDNS